MEHGQLRESAYRRHRSFDGKHLRPATRNKLVGRRHIFLSTGIEYDRSPIIDIQKSNPIYTPHVGCSTCHAGNAVVQCVVHSAVVGHTVCIGGKYSPKSVAGLYRSQLLAFQSRQHQAPHLAYLGGGIERCRQKLRDCAQLSHARPFLQGNRFDRFLIHH